MSQLMKGICIAISIKGSGIMKLTSELVNWQKLVQMCLHGPQVWPAADVYSSGLAGLRQASGGAGGNEAGAAGHFSSSPRETRCYSDLPTPHSPPPPPCLTRHLLIRSFSGASFFHSHTTSETQARSENTYLSKDHSLLFYDIKICKLNYILIYLPQYQNYVSSG